MAEITKVYKEHLPALRLIGKRYGEADCKNGSYGHLWGEWFQNNRFATLEALGEVTNIENGYLGFMRCQPNPEYWIGMFLPPETTVPEGFDFVDLAEGDVGICWIKGNADDGKIFGMHDECIKQLKANGMGAYRMDSQGRCYFFERYNCPRFTTADEQGNVILDYGIYL